MRTEVPKPKRCCFCIPLRRGLLFWGYLHLVATTLFTLGGIYYWIAMIVHGYLGFDTEEAITLVMFFNFALSIVLIYGAHKKNYGLLKFQYHCAVASAIILTVIVIADICIEVIPNWHLMFRLKPFMRSIVSFATASFTYILLQLYVIVMVRSEVFKLRDNQQFMFTNQAADAEAKCMYIDNELKENQPSV